MLDLLPMAVPPVIAFLIGARFGRRASLITLIACVLGAIALSVYARAAVSASGLPGWAYYGTFERNLPMTLGIALVLASIVATVQLAVRELTIAFGLSFGLVTLFFALFLPYMFVACAGFGACI